MAEGESTGQRLYEFTNNLLEDLSTQRITPEEALIALEQYGYLRGTMAQSLDALAGSLTNTEQFRSELKKMVTLALGQLNQSLPQLRQTRPDGALPPGEIAARAKSLAGARENITTTLATGKNSLAQTRRAFIKALINNWIEQSRGTISAEQAQAGAKLIESTLSSALVSNGSLDAAFAQARLILEKSLPFSKTVLDGAYQKSQSVRGELDQATNIISRIATVPKAVLKHSEIRQTDWFTSVLVQELSTGSAPIAQAEEVATRITKTAEALSMPPPPLESIKRSGGIFQAFANTGFQKTLAGVADGAFLFLGPATQDRVLGAILAKTAQRVLADTDGLTKRLGEAFVNSPVFTEIKQKLQETITTPGGGVSPLTKTRSLVGDLFTTIIGSPIGERATGSPKEAFYTYLETLKANASLPPAQRFWKNALPNSPTWQYIYLSSLTMYSNPLRIPVVFPPLAQGQRGFGAPFPTLPPPQLNPFVVSGVGLLPRLVAGVGSFFSVPFSLLGGGVGNGLFGLVGRGIEGLFGSTFPGRWLIGARRAQTIPTRLVEDMPLLLGLVVVITLVLLFVVPSFLNPSYLSRVSNASALLCSRFSGGAYCGGRGGDAGEGTDEGALCDPAVDPSCAVAFCNSATQDCQWPIEGRGCIVQGPNGTYSHTDMNAIDISAPRGRAVYAAHDGTVMGCNGDGGHYETSFAVDEHQNNSYGNIVQIQGTDGTNSFSTLYGHLERVLVKPCEHVTRGQAIGTIDNNGYSSGNHLHFEYRDGGSIWSILPPGLNVGVCYGG